jgi:hypothetical protein
VYGSWAFETTLRSLGIVGIRQGEIVYYKNEVNFILYASDTVLLGSVMKATDSALRLFENNPSAYGAVSIFVPSRFLPQVPQQGVLTQQAVMTQQGVITQQAVVTQQGVLTQQAVMPQQLFMQGVITLPYQIQHRRFCVKEKRNIIVNCAELIRF